MAEIGLELNRIRQISDEIKGLDETLISRYFNELYGILNGIESTVNQDDNVFGTVGRITRNADNIAQKLGSSLKSLENFIDTQLEDYSRNENTAYDRLRAVLERMAKLLGLDIKSLKIDSPSTVVNPTVSGGSSPSYVTPAASAMGAGAFGTMGYAGGQFLTDAHRDALMRQAEMEGRTRDAYNVSNSVTPEPIIYPADSIPSLNRSSAVGPDGRRFNVWVGDDNRIYDENGGLMTSMYMTKNGAIVETADMEYFIKRCGSEKESYEFYRKAYASLNGIKYEQVKDEYLTPEFIAKCDSDFINHYMPADGTDLDVAKEFKAVAESRVPGITGGLGDETPAGNGVPEVAKNVNPNMGVGANTEHAPSTSKDPNLIKDRFGAQYGGKAEAHDIRNTPSNGSSNGDIVNLPGNPNEKPKVNNLPGNPNEDVEVTPLSNSKEVSSIPPSSNSGGQVPSKNGGSSVANSGSSSRNDSSGTAHGALGKKVYFSDLPQSAPSNLNRSDAASSIFGTDAYVKGNLVVDKNGKTLGTISGNTIIDVNNKPVAVGTPKGIVNLTTGGSSATAGLTKSTVASNVFGEDAYVKGNTFVDKNGKTLGTVSGNTIIDVNNKPVAVGTPKGVVSPTTGGSSATAGLSKSAAASTVFGTDAYVKGNTFVDKNGKTLGTVSGNTIIDVNNNPVAVGTPKGVVSPTTGGSSATAGLSKSAAASTVFGTDAYVKGNTFVDKNGKTLGTVSGNTIIDVNNKPVAVGTPKGIVSPTTGGSSASAGSLSHSEVASKVYGTDAYVTGNTVIDKNGRMMGMVNGNAMVDTRGNTVAVGTPAGIKSVSSSYTGTVGSSTPGSTPLPDSIPGFGNQSTSVFTNPGKPVTATPTPAAIKSNIPGKGSSTSSYSGIAQLFQ